MIGPDNSYRCPNRMESWSGPQHYYYCLEMRLRSSRAWVPLSHHFPVAVDAQTTDMGQRGNAFSPLDTICRLLEYTI